MFGRATIRLGIGPHSSFVNILGLQATADNFISLITISNSYSKIKTEENLRTRDRRTQDFGAK